MNHLSRISGIQFPFCRHRWMDRMVILALLAVLFPGSLYAGKGKDWFHRLDSLLEIRYYRGNYDTAYVVRPHARVTIRNREGLSGTGMTIRSTMDGVLQTSRLSADHRFVVSLGVSYRGLSLSYSLNPAKLRGIYKDFEFETNEYNNKWGFDVVLLNTKSLSGTHTSEGEVQRISPGDIHQVSVYLDGFYAFNNRRFSYAAAFSQSYLQKQSAGSWLVGGSFMGTHLSFNSQSTSRMLHADLRFIHIGVGGGYGYNFVPGKGWLIHVSALPNLIIYDRSRLSLDGDKQRLKYRFPEMVVTGRFAVVRNFKHTFLGTQVVANYSADGSKRKLFVSNRKWRGRIFFGVRF